jgi:Tfp pilus assembly protein PilW
MELLISAAITIVTLSVAIQVATQVERGYTAQLDAAAVEEEARFALDWIGRTLRSAGSNPYAIVVSSCPAAGTMFLPLRFDPNLNGINDDVRINADVNEPNGLLGGDAGACAESSEDVTIAHDPVANTITMRDNNTDAAPVVMTAGTISALQFTYLDTNRVVTADPAAVAYVQVAVTAQGTAMNAQGGSFDTTMLTTEVRLWSR